MGTDIGPDLSQIGRKYERKALLETIMNPSAGMAPEYTPYVVETESGKVYAGFLHDQNDQRVVLKTTEGVMIEVPRGQIVEQPELDRERLLLRGVLNAASEPPKCLLYVVARNRLAIDDGPRVGWEGCLLRGRCRSAGGSEACGRQDGGGCQNDGGRGNDLDPEGNLQQVRRN